MVKIKAKMAKNKKTHSQLGIAFFLNFIFTLIELMGGYLTNSIAIYSNALHDLGDSLSLGFSYVMEKLAGRKGSHKIFTYGYHRFSLLAALVSGIILVGGSVVVIYEAVMRLNSPELSSATGMFWLAVVGLAVNGLAVLKLQNGTTLNARLVRVHLMEDVMSWAAILLTALAIWFFGWHVLDPILSIIITVFVLTNVIRHLNETLMLFLQGKPSAISAEAIEQVILALDPVKRLHDMHIWSLDGENHVLTAHVVLKKGTSAKKEFEVKCCIKRLVNDFAAVHTTLEMEREGEGCDTSNKC